jgi:protease IV
MTVWHFCAVSYNILKALTAGTPWLITEAAANAYFPTIMAMLNGEAIPVDAVSAKEKAATFNSYNLTPNAAGAGATAHTSGGAEQYITVIPYKDVVVKYAEACGPMGTEHMAEQIMAAANDPNCSAIIIDLDTPGGAGNAVQRPSEAIAYAKQIKPVVAYAGNGMAASAGYWIASQCDEIYATYSTDEVGSIGTYITLVDMNKAYTNRFGGAKVESVYATKSTAKNKGYRDWTAGDDKFLKQNDLDPFNEEFIAAVKAGRGDKITSDDVFDGRLVRAEQALSFGLIDGLRTFAATIQRAAELSANRNNNSKSMKILVNNMDAVVDAVNAGNDVTTEQIGAANAELATRGLVLNTTTDAATAADMATNLQTLANELNTANALLKAEQQKAADLKASADATAAALGLTVTEAGYTDQNNDPVTLESVAEAVVAQRDTYGKQAGIIEVTATERTEATEEPVSDFDKEVDARLAQGV